MVAEMRRGRLLRTLFEISRTHFAVDLVHSFMGDFTLKLSLGPPSVVDDGMPFSTQLPRWAFQTGAYCVR